MTCFEGAFVPWRCIFPLKGMSSERVIGTQIWIASTVCCDGEFISFRCCFSAEETNTDRARAAKIGSYWSHAHCPSCRRLFAKLKTVLFFHSDARSQSSRPSGGAVRAWAGLRRCAYGGRRGTPRPWSVGGCGRPRREAAQGHIDTNGNIRVSQEGCEEKGIARKRGARYFDDGLWEIETTNLKLRWMR